jgi:hypothetical protein
MVFSTRYYNTKSDNVLTLVDFSQQVWKQSSVWYFTYKSNTTSEPKGAMSRSFPPLKSWNRTCVIAKHHCGEIFRYW